MKKVIFILFSFLLTTFIFLSSAQKIKAINLFSLEEIQLHASSEDCWMLIDNKVYDLSNYLPDHDRYLDIREWCGRDATEDYNTKAGMNRDHSLRADEMLAAYLIGEFNQVQNDIESDEQQNTVVEVEQGDDNLPIIVEDKQQEDDLLIKQDLQSEINSPNPDFAPKYKVLIPVLLTAFAYYLTKKFLSKARHDFLWNSVLLIGFIPVVGFGFILALADQLAFLAKLNLNQMLHQHAQLSIIIGTAMLLHFIQRAKIYMSQGRVALKKKI